MQSGLQMLKTVALNGQRDSLSQPVTDTLALQHLLKPFMDVDINRPSLRDAYRTDTVKDLFSGNSSIQNSCPADSGAHDFNAMFVRLVA